MKRGIGVADEVVYWMVPVNIVHPRAMDTEASALMAIVVVGGQCQLSVVVPLQSFSVIVAEYASISHVLGGHATTTGSISGQRPGLRLPVGTLPLGVPVGIEKLPPSPPPGPHAAVMLGQVSRGPMPIEGQGGMMRKVVVA